MKRLRLYDLRNSRLPGAVGLCASDVSLIAQLVNSAQARLIHAAEAGDEGWFGTWAEIAFEVSRDKPFITLPREVARAEMTVVCDNPVTIRNQFYEYLTFGNGRMPKNFRQQCGGNILDVFSRNNVVLFTEMTDTPNYIRVYPTGDADAAFRMLIQGYDQNNKRIYSMDGVNRVDGVYVPLTSPFATTDALFSRITGIQKDNTAGPVQVFQVNPTTSDETLLLEMQPSEETAWYRRYYFDQLPFSCCNNPNNDTAQPIQVKAIAKLEPIPVYADPDYLVIQNLEALIEECQSVRYSEIDTVAAKQMSQERHLQAIRLLNGELTHYFGKDTVSVSFAPFGSARLENQRIGIIT